MAVLLVRFPEFRQVGQVIPGGHTILALLCVGANAARLEADSPVTFSKEIAPIIFENCAGCHRSGQVGPFPLVTYAEAKKHATDIGRVTASHYMPPWLPEAGFGEFVSERHLTDAQIQAIQKWVSNDAPEGDSRELPSLPHSPEGWQLGPPDLIVELPDAYALAAEGRDLYRNFVIPAPSHETRFVRAFEFHPRNRAVHHVRIKFDSTRQSRRLDAQDAEVGFSGMKTPGKFPPGHMTTWTPGQVPQPVLDGLQWPLEKDADIVIETHLQRTGREENIRPQIGFYFTNSPPTKSSFLVGLTSELIDIPPGETNYVVERKIQLPVDVLALTILPHLHYLGREVEAFALLPTGEREPLLRILDWDFNWQGEYHYRHSVSLPAGSTVTMRYRYDNSAANARQPNHPVRRVVYGPQSTDEMAELWLQVLVKNSADLALLQKTQRNVNDLETVAFYETQLHSNPQDAAVHTALGKVLGPMGRLPEAITHFRLAAEIDPGLAEAHYYLGLSLLTVQDIGEAEQQFQAALGADPAYVKAFDGLGLIALKLNRLDEAEKHFRRALEINPDDPAAKANLQKLGR